MIYRALGGYLARRGWTDDSITQVIELANTDDDSKDPKLRIRNAMRRIELDPKATPPAGRC